MHKLLLFILLLLISSTTLFSQSDYVLKCDFNPEDVEWTQYNETEVVTKTSGGKYYIEHKDAESGWNQTREVYVNPTIDFEINLAVKQTDGAADNGYGLVFGRKDKDNSYSFLISSDGQYAVGKIVSGKKSKLVEWTKTEGINNLNKTNVLSLKRISGKWIFSVNDKELYTIDAPKTFGMSYGFFVSGKTSLEIDYLYVKQKNKPINLIEKSDAFGEREHMGTPINSSCFEKSPVISADEKTLYFVRNGHPDNIGKDKESDIWFSTYNETTNTWSNAKNMGAPWNTSSNNYIISISADNTSALLGNKYDSLGNVSGKGISISYKKRNGWSRPKEMKIKNYYNYSIYSESCLSPEGNVLLTACHRDETVGEKDIYVSFLQADSTWSEPKNIGKVVNTFADEVGPFLAADGKTMYFSSAGHPGYGSNDIYMTRRLDNTWTNWSEPQNLGPKVNTNKWDAYYTVPASGKNAYLVSSTTGAKSDIYKIKQPESAKPLPLVLVHGIVYNSDTKKTMGADITYSELGSTQILGHATSDPITGSFTISLVQGKKYSFYASQKEFISVHYSYDASNLNSYKEETVDMYLSPLKKGVSIIMNNLFFTANKFDILPESYPELDKLYQLLIDNPTVTIEIGGHTSINTSGEKFNQELSTNRAAAVKNYIINKGINKKRISSKGYGYTKPIYKTEVEADQAKNRRVEFTILTE